jgi:signal transduction histidine kinase
LKRKDGTDFLAEVVGTNIKYGEEQCVLGVVRDITEREQAEQEKLSLERQVQHAQKLESLGLLAGGIAHDFNNLLTAILGNADLALDELPDDSPARVNIQEIESASKRAAELARQMLAYSGKGRFIIQAICCRELVEEIGHLLDVSVSKKINIKHEYSDDSQTFAGDATQIRQVIMNLITNASESIGDKTGTITLSTGVMDCTRVYLNNINKTLLVSMSEPLSAGTYT